MTFSKKPQPWLVFNSLGLLKLKQPLCPNISKSMRSPRRASTPLSASDTLVEEIDKDELLWSDPEATEDKT